MTDELHEEFCVVDEHCHCRRVVRSLEVAEKIVASGTIWSDDRPSGPLHIERRLATRWAPWAAS